MGIKDGVGTPDADVSTTDPLVQAIGTTTGIGLRKVNGFFNFFDGKIIGSTYAKPDTTSNTESRWEARFYLVFNDNTELEVKQGDEDDYTYKYEYSKLEYLGEENTQNPERDLESKKNKIGAGNEGGKNAPRQCVKIGARRGSVT